ncbi:hypothetical protein [Pseudonocardia spinosispora]|uniref:hypothetical protein n=1 Tax=Pseudonocardia spinosispora TaxID=103441 RepID=UPI0003FA7446|nr:hypothetical protein [Pseudonocardia spinosispora]
MVVNAARAAPFVVFAVGSIWAAGRAPQGRRSPRFDWTITTEIASHALSKIPHLKWAAVLFLLAVVAVGVSRAGLAALATFTVGLGWELAETTVIGHHAALIDLLPDLVAVLAGWLLVSGTRAAAQSARSRWGDTCRRRAQELTAMNQQQ